MISAMLKSYNISTQCQRLSRLNQSCSSAKKEAEVNPKELSLFKCLHGKYVSASVWIGPLVPATSRCIMLVMKREVHQGVSSGKSR